MFGSPIQYQLDSLHPENYEASPPYENDEEDNYQGNSIKQYLDRLVSDEEIEFKSGDEQSINSMQSPQLSAVGTGLRVPVSTFHGYGPGINISHPK